MDSDKDEHLSFEDERSDIPIEEILKKYPSDAWVTLEVSRNWDATERDLEYIKGLVG